MKKKKKEILNFKPEAVLHLAWEGIPDYSEQMSKLNFYNTINFLSFVIENTECKKIIIPGSCWEYNDGHVNGECFEEMKIDPKKPFSIYKKKIFDDLIYKTDKRKITLNWARLFYVYGPNQKNKSLVPILLDSFANNKELYLTSPNNKHDFIYIDDVVKILIIMLQSNIPSGIYNVGTGIATSVRNLSCTIEKFFYKNCHISRNLKEINKNSALNFFASTNKFKKYINNFEFENIKSGLYKTYKYFINNNSSIL